MNHLHEYKPSEKRGYEVCECGTYHSTMLEDPASIYENDYWSHEKGRSNLVEQRWNMTERESCGISKVEKVMDYIPEKGSILEVGCAPAVLLKLLALTGREVYGIEPDINVINKMKEFCNEAVYIEGYFPQVFQKGKSNIFDCIVALDVLEHSIDYVEFIEATHRLLKPNGTAIFMSPIICEDGLYRECDFEVPEQHAWIFSKSYLESYLSELFSKVQFDIWQLGHNMIILNK